MSLLQRLTDDMKTALKAGEKERLQVIRMLLSDVKNIDLMPGKPTAEAVVEAYAKKLRKSTEEYEKLGKSAEVKQLQSEIAIVDTYLPKKATSEETATLLDTFLEGKGFTEKDTGRATGQFMKSTTVPLDPATVSKLLREKLAGK